MFELLTYVDFPSPGCSTKKLGVDCVFAITLSARSFIINQLPPTGNNTPLNMYICHPVFCFCEKVYINVRIQFRSCWYGIQSWKHGSMYIPHLDLIFPHSVLDIQVTIWYPFFFHDVTFCQILACLIFHNVGKDDIFNVSPLLQLGVGLPKLYYASTSEANIFSAHFYFGLKYIYPAPGLANVFQIK